MEQKEARTKYQQVGQCYKAGRYPETLALLDEVEQAYPSNSEIAYMRALTLVRLQRFDEAEQVCEKMATVYNDPRASQIRANMEYERGPVRKPADDDEPIQPHKRLVLAAAAFAVVLLVGALALF